VNRGDHTIYTPTWRRVNTLIEVLVLVRVLILGGKNADNLNGCLSRQQTSGIRQGLGLIQVKLLQTLEAAKEL